MILDVLFTYNLFNSTSNQAGYSSLTSVFRIEKKETFWKNTIDLYLNLFCLAVVHFKII